MRHFDSLDPDGGGANWAVRWTRRGPRNWRLIYSMYYPHSIGKYGLSPVCAARLRRREEESNETL